MVDTILNFFLSLSELGNKIFTNILNFLFDFLEFIFKFLFGWINIPAFPEEFKSSINSFFDLIFNNLQFLGFFIRPTTLKIAIPLILFLVNFKYIYKLSMWIIRKIPGVNIK